MKMKSLLLVLMLCAVSRAEILWDQWATAPLSSLGSIGARWSASEAYENADDFVVPPSEVWGVESFCILGASPASAPNMYRDITNWTWAIRASIPVSSAYHSRPEEPGAPVASGHDTPVGGVTDTSPCFDLAAPVWLTPGRYWLLGMPFVPTRKHWIWGLFVPSTHIELDVLKFVNNSYEGRSPRDVWFDPSFSESVLAFSVSGFRVPVTSTRATDTHTRTATHPTASATRPTRTLSHSRSNSLSQTNTRATNTHAMVTHSHSHSHTRARTHSLTRTATGTATRTLSRTATSEEEMESVAASSSVSSLRVVLLVVGIGTLVVCLVVLAGALGAVAGARLCGRSSRREAATAKGERRAADSVELESGPVEYAQIVAPPLESPSPVGSSEYAKADFARSEYAKAAPCASEYDKFSDVLS